jgi:zinc transporter 7
MVSRRNRTLLSLAIFLGVLGWNVAAAAVKGETGVPVGNLSAHEIEEQLQVRHSLAGPIGVCSMLPFSA